MAFKYSLATLLRVREIAEEREERLLGRILAQVAATRNELNQLQAQVSQMLKRRESDLATLTSAAQLHISYGQMRALEEMQKDLTAQLAKLEKLRDEQIKTYELSRRNREVLTQHKEDRREEHRYEAARQEQNFMDDVFNSKRLSN
jgi:flagellar FliJ protein